MEDKELKGEELVGALLFGSSEIDRMRKETDQVVRMITGFLIHNGCTMMSHRYPWKSNDGRIYGAWHVHDDKDGCFVEFTLMSRPIYDSGDGAGASRIPLQAVQLVRAALGALVDGVKDAFPSSASNRWQPLLDAAAAAKQRGITAGAD